MECEFRIEMYFPRMRELRTNDWMALDVSNKKTQSLNVYSQGLTNGKERRRASGRGVG